MLNKTINHSLKNLIEEKKIEFFNEPQKATDEDVLGIMISQYLEWDGNKIFKTAYNAFEDANFHEFNEKIEKIWKGVINMGQYDDIISENLERIANSLEGINNNLTIITNMALIESSLKGKTPDQVAKVKNAFKDIKEILKN
jgi:hypothetical protein